MAESSAGAAETRPAFRARHTPSFWYRLTNSEAVLALVCIAPATLLLLFILAYPVIQTLAFAFYSRDLLKAELGTQFVGLANFAWLLDYDRFWLALQNSVLLTVVTVFFELAIAMVVALMLAEPFRGVGIVRGLFILPWAIPTIVTAFVWRGLFSPRYGLINQVISEVGRLVSGPSYQFQFDWLSNSAFAMLGVIIVYIWRGFPFVFLVLLAGLQSLPQELSDAARIDGANGWKEFWYVTLPQLKPVILIAVILRTITVFNWFDLVWLLTGGGPQNATLVLPILVYNRAFVAFQVGRASVITAVMFVILAILTYFFLSQQRDEEHAR
ncbi:MAG: sugar ABC transporter permease [Chloroflexi bacterium]|nr:sugar ABC transporter permease [Chloroflexota bacterium]